MIKPSVYVIEAGLLAVCLLWQRLCWRKQKPANEVGALLTVFFLPLAPVLCLWFRADGEGTDLIALVLLHASLAFAYIQTYPALISLSPSLAILIKLSRSEKGLTEAELCQCFDFRELLEDPVRDLIRSGLIAEAEGQLSITSRGQWFLRPFLLFRNGLGAGTGGG